MWNRPAIGRGAKWNKLLISELKNTIVAMTGRLNKLIWGGGMCVLTYKDFSLVWFFFVENVQNTSERK